MGAGILPTTIHKNKIYFLFFKENKFADTPGWSDMGGGKDNKESYIETAIREGGEELTGFLGSKIDLKKKIKKYGTYNIDLNNNYRMHIFPMEYEPMIVHYYNNNQRFIQKNLDENIIKNCKIFEKSEIRWISIDEISKMKKEFRSYFQNIIEIILQERKNIESFIRKSLSSYSSSHFKYKKRTSFFPNRKKNNKTRKLFSY
jgi:transcription termination factor NusB